MADFVEKTFGSIPGLITGGVASDSESHTTRTRSFRNFVQSIASIKSRHEEEELVNKELSLQKQRLSKAGLTGPQKQESLTRIVYCHMLGYDVSFACIHAVKLAQQGALQEKKVGYLVCSMLLHESHEFVVLLVNTIQKDLRSTNVLEICTALTVITQLMSSEMVPPLLPLVQDKLSHPKEMVRRRAVLCLQYMIHKVPDIQDYVEPGLRRALEDRDPGVVWASLHGFHQLIQTDPSVYRDLVPGLTNILSQVLSHHLRVDYEYHSVPAPWLVILLLKLLARLGAGDLNTSQKIYPILKDVLHRTEPSHKMGLAVIYECMQTITSIYPHPALVDIAAKCVGRFLSAHNINLRYIGLKALTSLVQVNPLYAADHQQTVLDCLTHTHQTVRVKTLELLYRMANSANVQVISDRLLCQLPTTTDHHQRVDIIHKVVDITCRLEEGVLGSIATMNRILLLKDESLIPGDAGCRVISLLQAGVRTDREAREEAVKTYWELLQSPSLPSVMLQTAAWVLGEYSHLVTSPDTNQIVTVLVDWFTRCSSHTTRLWILSALKKLHHQVAAPQEMTRHLQVTSGDNESLQVRQAVRELTRLVQVSQTVREALKPRDSVNSTQLDLSLSFLDNYVSESLDRGATPYLPRGLRHVSTQPHTDSKGLPPAPCPDTSSETSGSVPEPAPGSLPSDTPRPDWSSSVSASSYNSNRWTASEESGLQVAGVRKVWGKEGLLKAPLTDRHTDTEVVLEDTEVSKSDERQQLAAALFGSLTDSFASQVSVLDLPLYR
ncbi:hypothetical protein NP493_129g04034 [Ridgeia piscesae]|uniref:Clathrin/coatomer adaptor adaptin-like N-terminal domain-containing protein n=1 Tax=Ridgeia piscesae TaxID=27915 RepID=A0AAD9P5J9_RIDPI|nr:hypothetical protein NP493_129g04034 [Ridgeia piscesae]